MKRTFHHIGLPAPDQETPLPGESWVQRNRCWVTNPAHTPQRVEWLRYAPDSPIDPVVREAPHICYLVDDLDRWIADKTIAVPPFEPGEPPFGRAAFTVEDGITVEYLQLYPGRTWFDDERAKGDTQ